MNLARILDTALPDLPPQRLPDRMPRMYPKVIAREHEEREGTMVRLIIPNGPPHYYRLTKLQYELTQLFDGNRTYEEIAELFIRRTGVNVSAQEVREFADSMEKTDFWYKTPFEESVILCHELAEQRHKAIKHKRFWADVTTIELWYFDPQKFLDWLYPKLKFMYTGWFFLWTLFMAAVAVVILGSHWRQFWADNLHWYDLAGRGVSHFVAFFGVFLIVGAVHEIAHGISCHHYGGKSHKMGFFTMYLAPAVFCDCAEAFVVAGRWGRIVTVASGVWSEIILCSYLSVVWWLTPPATFWHDFSYLLILSGGVFPIIINWNPLSRMDGYFIFCEIFRIFDLKGQSTAYLVSLVRKYIFRMPATVPALPPRRRVGFVVYAILSGVYCYSLLLFFARLVYHVLYYYSPVWAFVPATLLGLLIFRSRIKKLAQFFKELYLDKRELMKTHWKPIAALATVVLILLLIPIRRECVAERFILEPQQRAVVRTSVPGRVTEVLVDEGQQLKAGDSLVRMRDLALESRAQESAANYAAAASRARDAEMRYAGFAAAEQHRINMAAAKNLVAQQAQMLNVTTPIGGVVTTPRVHDLAGTYVPAGTLIAEVADTSVMRARVYVSEAEFHKLRVVSGNSLRMDAMWGPVEGTVIAISPTTQPIQPGLMPSPDYQGTHLPGYFVVEVLLHNSDGALRDGMTGLAKVYGSRTALLESILQPVINAVARRIW
jgi:putative peptide zinc metalloprotease protein